MLFLNLGILSQKQARSSVLAIKRRMTLFLVSNLEKSFFAKLATLHFVLHFAETKMQHENEVFGSFSRFWTKNMIRRRFYGWDDK
jgi:hypothetical protein